MTRHERCGRPYLHLPHPWQEGEETHLCDGGSDEIDALDAHEAQDALMEKGAY